MLLSVIKNARLLKIYDIVKTSFWFTPSLMLFITVLSCIALAFIDLYSQLHTVNWLGFLYYADPDITRSLLTTIASCVITVVSITFSITMVALTNATSQFGPRLIRNFMEDSSTQIVLGTFISLFAYCLILVRLSDHFADGQYLPGLAIAGAIFMTLSGIFLLIYFIHHVSLNLQSDHIIDNVYSELLLSISNIFQGQKEEEGSQNKHNKEVKKETNTTGTPINQSDYIALKSMGSGYIQAINYNELTCIVSELGDYLEIVVSPGDFIVDRMILMHYYADELTQDNEQRLQYCFILGAQRTPIQDPEYAVHQLVEIALRALSPGINDPYSAIACIDKLTAALCDLTQKSFPHGHFCDDNNIERIQYKTTSFEDLANITFNQIRQYSQTCLAVRIRQIESLIKIAEQANQTAHWSFLNSQTFMIEHEIKQQRLVNRDKQDVNRRLKTLRDLLQKNENK